MIYWLVSLAALVGVVLNIRKHPGCFAIWTVTNAAWCAADWASGLHAQSCLMAVYCVLSIWGLWTWGRGRAASSHGEVCGKGRNG